MDTIAKQKALADRVYALLGKFDVLLAGGAPRDWHIGQEARDLDFYIYSNTPEIDAKELGVLIDTALTPLGGDGYEEMMGEPSLLAVYEGETHGQKVQFMFVNISPLYFVREKFDISVCKVWYKGGEICMDWEARLSFRERVLVMKDGFKAHAGKLMQRDPWSTCAFMGSWGRALDLIAEVPARPFEQLFEEVAVEWGGENPANGAAMPNPQANVMVDF